MPEVSPAWLDLADRAADHDGVDPIGEAPRLALAAPSPAPWVRVHEVEGEPVAVAVAIEGAPIELVVDPGQRRRGYGRALLDACRAERPGASFWAHGDLPAAQGLAVAAGLGPTRTLLLLRLPIDEAAAARLDHPVTLPPGVTLRSFRPDDPADAAAVVAVNARAFADHPEQGAMDAADFARRAASHWFDPAGLFLAERDGEVVGFHWTKIEHGIGEVYVVGVDPSAHGGGLGTALTARGLQHLRDAGVPVVDLYVEGDNGPALTVYRRLGFVDHARDTVYG